MTDTTTELKTDGNDGAGEAIPDEKMDTICVAGETVSISYEQIYSTEPEKIPEAIAHWEATLGRAEAERMIIDAEYRQWRAEYLKAIMGKDQKLAEWRANFRVECDPGFIQWKQGLATCLQHIAICRGLLKAFEIRADLERG
jgi:hypothetical protein